MANAGDVVVTLFPGAQVTKRRPAIVLSSDEYHKTRPDVIIGLVTSQVSLRIGPTDCELLDWSQAGLRTASVFRAYLFTTLSSNVINIGRQSDRDWAAVRNCLSTAVVT